MSQRQVGGIHDLPQSAWSLLDYVFPSLKSETFFLPAIMIWWWFWPLSFPLVLFIFLFSLFLLPNCQGLSDVVLTGGFCIATHNCLICFLILGLPQLPIISTLSPSTVLPQMILLYTSYPNTHSSTKAPLLGSFPTKILKCFTFN